MNDKEKIYSNDDLEKYFIRGQSLNSEETYFYNECKNIDFLDKNEVFNTNKIFLKTKKLLNKDKNYIVKSQRKNRNNFNKYGLEINYSLKNLLNNKLPLMIEA